MVDDAEEFRSVHMRSVDANLPTFSNDGKKEELGGEVFFDVRVPRG